MLGFAHLCPRCPFMWSLPFSGGLAVVVWRVGPPKGQGGHRSTRNGPWSKKNNLSPCLWTATLNPDSSEKQNCSFRSWAFVERVQGRAEETELFRVPPRGTPTLPGDPCSARGEPLDPESGTKAVAPLCSLPWANWKWPLGSYRFLSVWGTSSRGRTHRSRGVQFISGRPGRQILREKQMLLTMPHPRAMTALWSAKYFPPHPHPGEKEKGRNRNTDAEKTCVDVAGGGRHTGWPGRLGLTSIHDHVWNRQLVGLCLTPQGAQCSVVTSRSGMGVEGGKVVHERGDVCMHIADSLSWTAETNITLWCNYIPV